MVEDGEQIEIGGNSRYISVCRRHYQRKMMHRDPADDRKDKQRENVARHANVEGLGGGVGAVVTAADAAKTSPTKTTDPGRMVKSDSGISLSLSDVV